MEYRRRKLKYARKLAKMQSFVMFQEVHGTLEEMESALQFFESTHRIFLNPGDGRAIGGLVTLVPLTFCKWATLIVKEDLVVGRVTRIFLRGPGGTLILFNFHNFGISDEMLAAVFERVEADRCAMVADPTHSALILGGDFNFDLKGGIVRFLDGTSDNS
eukprot:10190823-Karenia_brevis.AAC.2